MTCECDFDCVGDPLRYVRSNPSTLCPMHDTCGVCDDAKAVIIVDGTKCCKKCALEDIQVCPNCGWEAEFFEETFSDRQPHGEVIEETMLFCKHCQRRTDYEELRNTRVNRMSDIRKRLEEMGL